jgi:tetratricopeptide (TPR) repeat protein
VTRFYLGQALSGIGSDPAGWLALMGRKLLLVTNRVEPTDTEEYNVYAEYSHVLGATAAVLHFGILLPLAFFGVWITWSERRRLWPYYGLVAVQLASAVVFYVSGRQRLTILPIVLLLAGAGLTGIPGFFRSRSGSSIAAGLAATAAVTLLVAWPWFDWRTVRSMTYYNLGNELAELGVRERAALRYETALELDPDNALARNNYGVLLAQFKMPGAAAREFRQALRIVPDYADAHFNLARVLRDAFDDAGAIEHYRAGLALDPGRPEVYVELGRTQLDVGDRAGARESFLRALQMDPQNEGAAAGLQALRQASQSRAEAIGTP